jgi:hypothetical protein
MTAHVWQFVKEHLKYSVARMKNFVQHCRMSRCGHYVRLSAPKTVQKATPSPITSVCGWFANCMQEQNRAQKISAEQPFLERRQFFGEKFITETVVAKIIL